MKNDAVPIINTFKHNGAEFIEIINNVGMSVTFSNFGAAIYQIKYLDELMTSQVKNIDDFFNNKVYNGKAIGRVAGRLEGSSIKIDGKEYKLSPNEDGNVLHGGEKGISTRLFSQRVFNTTEHVHVVYTLFSSAGHCGFPGNALFEVHYIVSNNKPKLKVKLLSYVTEKCPVSLTGHAFLSLGEKNLDNISMKINASKYLDIRSKDLILGKEKAVPSYLDFRKAKSILKDINAKEINEGKLHGYDHCFIFDKVDDEIPQVSLEGSKFKVNVFTNFDSVVIYSDNYPDGYERDNSKDKSRRGVAVEPQLNPSKDRYLSRGDEFDYFYRYEFEKK